MGAIREEINNSDLEQLPPPVVINATKEDIEPATVVGFDSATFVALVGASTVELNDDRYVEIKLQHSNNKDANFVNCKDEELVG